MRPRTLFIAILLSALAVGQAGVRAQEAAPSPKPAPVAEAGPDDIQRAIDGLSSRFFEDRAEARERIRILGEPTVPALVSLLGASRPALQVEAARLLGDLRSSAGIDPLVRLLSSENLAVSGAAESALIRIGEAARPALEAEKARHPALADRLDAVLAFLQQRQVEALLNACITEQEGWGHYEGQYASLAAMKPPPTAVLLRLFLGENHEFTDVTDDENRQSIMRLLAGEALGDLGDPAAIEPLTQYLEQLKRGGHLVRHLGRDTAIFSLYKLGVKAPAESERAALEAAPGPQRDWGRLAEICTRLGDYPAALAAYEARLAQVSEENLQKIECYNMSCILSVMGRKQESVAFLRKAVDKGYRDWDWMERDGDLRSIRSEAEYQEILLQGRKQDAAEEAGAEEPPGP
ncbi:MAG: hypothetical protein HYY93_06110 [Planctomycetes bacterium]|nr:hypothetical protein [Planctomycetota bacterium]